MSLRTAFNYALLVIGSIIVAFPLLLALSYSLMSESEIASFPPPILPEAPTLDNYGKVFATIPIGRYLLRFHMGAYFTRLGTPQSEPPFLDMVPVEFAVAEAEGHYHVPLLVTPWSYSTYRGS